MAKKEKLRNEIDDVFKWKLETMYETDQIWEKDYQYILNNLDRYDTFKGNVLSSASNLLELLKFDIEIDRIFSKLYVYACMRSDEDTTNTYYQTLRGKVENLGVKISEKTSFIIPEILRDNYSLIEKFYEEEPELKEHEINLKNIFRYKNHVLSDKEEKMLSTMSKIFNYPNKIASYIRNTDLQLGTIIDEDGEEVVLTNSNYSVYLESRNREVRKQAFTKMYEAYGSMKNTFASAYAGEVDGDVLIAKLKNYESSRQMSLYSNNISLSVYDNLIDTVNNNMHIIYKYYDLIKRVIKVDELHLYDVYTDFLENSNKRYDFDQAKELVINALSVLGEEYKEVLHKSFSEKWIDVYPNKGKKNGAYSWGCYDSNPFILLNYEGKLDDVSTLAHELGHSIHSYYSKLNNPYQYHDYEIFVAEVASTVNEMLLCKYILNNSKDKEEKLTILERMLKLFKGTIYRQTMFAEFERDIHKMVEDGEILTHEKLGDYYYQLNKKYFGTNVVIDDGIRYEWSRIPHFYNSFYVYQYATGLSAACHIVNNILENKEGATQNYLEFLKTGGRDFPVELLKIAGVDMNNPEVIESALKLFSDTIDEFNDLYNS